ncbi:hypothetical protein [Streptomyces africanus]|uniref:hypothetical protein n=1 Tax=Streptomyces africanus TaxID=231024 RepID=UPI000A3C9A44|nr:hypothetical protein [Streptomyces africanus]
MTTTIGTEQVSLEDLTPFEGNARRGNVETILDSLRANGQYKPLTVRRQGETMTILAGNHTYLALLRHEESGRDACRDWELANDRPCQLCINVDADDPTALSHLIECDDDTAKRINLVDNKAADDGAYDEEALAAILGSLESGPAGTGYTDEEADSILARYEEEDVVEYTAPAVAGYNDDPEERQARMDSHGGENSQPYESRGVRDIFLAMPTAEADELGRCILALREHFGAMTQSEVVLRAARVAVAVMDGADSGLTLADCLARGEEIYAAPADAA